MTQDRTYKERLTRHRARLKELGFKRIEVLTNQSTADKLVKVARWAETSRDSVLYFLIHGEANLDELVAIMEADNELDGNVATDEARKASETAQWVKDALAFRLLDSARSVYRG